MGVRLCHMEARKGGRGRVRRVDKSAERVVCERKVMQGSKPCVCIFWLAGYQQQTGFMATEQHTTASFQQQPQQPQQQQQYQAAGGLPANRPPSSPAQQPLTPRGGSGSYSQVHTPQPSPIGSANGLQGGHAGTWALSDESCDLTCLYNAVAIMASLQMH